MYDNFLGCYKNLPNIYDLTVTRSGAFITNEGTVQYLDDETIIIKEIEIETEENPTQIWLLCNCMNSMGATSRVYQDKFFTDRETAIANTGKFTIFIARRIFSLKINYEDHPKINDNDHRD